MKLKYKEGDIFIIPIESKFFVCQIVFSPVAKFKKIIGFCILAVQDDKIFLKDEYINLISFLDMGKEIKTIFTGNENIKKGSWEIIGHADLTEEKNKLKIFNFAGGLYNGEDEIRRIPLPEYSEYPSMEVFGFDLVKNILLDILQLSESKP